MSSATEQHGRVVEARCATRQGLVDYEDVGFHDRDGNPIEVYDRDGNRLANLVPVVFRWRCRNPRCGVRHVGRETVHRMALYGIRNGRAVGEVWTVQEDNRPINELIQYLPPAQVRHIERG